MGECLLTVYRYLQVRVPHVLLVHSKGATDSYCEGLLCVSDSKAQTSKIDINPFFSSVFVSSFWGFINHQFSRLHVDGLRSMNGWRWIPVSLPQRRSIQLFTFIKQVVGGVLTVFTSVYVYTSTLRSIRCSWAILTCVQYTEQIL